MRFAAAMHVLTAVIWVGGLFFAYFVLRPVAAGMLETHDRLNLWRKVLKRFFLVVWISVIILFSTGYWMTLSLFGDVVHVPHYISVMQVLGILMVLIFFYVYFSTYQRLQKHLMIDNYGPASKILGEMRRFFGINLFLGVIVILVASSGQYWVN